MAARSELSIHHINRSAAAFSSEKAAGLRRCAETQNILHGVGQPNNC